MNKKKNKLLILGITTGLIILTSSFMFLKRPNKEENKKLLTKEETKSMLSYTLDGEKTDIKPTKGSGYIANKITCENGSNLIWDNTNWEVEIISLESNDICTVDFTKDSTKEGYRVSATVNVSGGIDSLSKSTIENGQVVFYTDGLHEIGSVSGCTGIIEEDKIVVENITSNQTCNITLTDPKLYRLLSNGKKYTLGTRGTFDKAFGGRTIQDGYNSTGTIYKTGNDYYFAGNPSDNWVKFVDKWWRIIRTNSTEGTRLLYAGTSAEGQDGYINNTAYKWNSTNNAYTYVYWGNASFKSTLNSWYTSNITGTNDNMVNTIVYCNDTSYTDRTDWGTDGRSFGAYNRLMVAESPSHSCGTNQFGAAAKVGMMTADEVAYAGGEYGNNAPNTYYYRNAKTSGCTGSYGDPCSVTANHYWWTLSPYYFQNGYASVFFVHGASGGRPGYLGNVYVSNSYAVRPVITLKPEVVVSGSGTANDPYIPTLTN